MGPASAISDYVAVPFGIVTIPAVCTSATITVNLRSDTRVESNETFELKIVWVTGATVRRNDAKGTIVNYDGPPRATAANVSLVEGNSGITNAAVHPGLPPIRHPRLVGRWVRTSNGSARSPGDYTPVDVVIPFAAGATSVAVTVPVRGDTVRESTETVRLAFSQAVGISLDTPTPPSASSTTTKCGVSGWGRGSRGRFWLARW